MRTRRRLRVLTLAAAAAIALAMMAAPATAAPLTLTLTLVHVNDWDRMAGIDGARVTGVTVGGTPLDDGAFHTLATNDFMARGGDGYAVFQAGEMLIDPASGTPMAGQLIDHIAAAGTVAPVIEGRITRQD